MGQHSLFQHRPLGEKDGILWRGKECGERRGRFSVGHRSYSDHHCFYNLWSLSVDFGAHRSSDPTYCSIWVLTLKRIYAEGLQHWVWKKEIRIGQKKRTGCEGSEGLVDRIKKYWK